jgi:hypothetical protein
MKVHEIVARADRSPSPSKPFYRPAEGELSADELSLEYRHSQLPAIRGRLISEALRAVVADFALDPDEALDALITVFSGYTRKFVNGSVQKASEGRDYSHRRRSRQCS